MDVEGHKSVQTKSSGHPANNEQISNTSVTAAKVIAFYLPQYHPIPENDEWWGKGFTEWTNVSKATPLFRGHYQPHIPADLGFYDLRVPEVREAQASLAIRYGIHAFCYWHYWSDGRLLLERPFNEVLESGKPDFPFCLAWANETWTRRWVGKDRQILWDQKYNHPDDDIEHFRWLLHAFQDKRYIKVKGKPLFLIYRPHEMPDSTKTCSLWRQMALEAGLPGVFLVAVENSGGPPPDPAGFGFDAAVDFQPNWSNLYLCKSRVGVFRLTHKMDSRFGSIRGIGRPWRLFMRALKQRPMRSTALICRYDLAVKTLTEKLIRPDGQVRFPCVCPRWDNSPRKGIDGVVLTHDDPDVFQRWLSQSIELVQDYDEDERLVFINAWNEWAEGNHLEPDIKMGHAYLEAVKRAQDGFRK